MDSPRETELKLRLPAGADRALRDAAVLRSAAPRTLQLDATYFDTPTRLLQANGMALRLRRVGRDWVQTLKAAAVVTGGLSSRPEWEAPATLRQGVPRIDLRQLRETPLPALLAQHRATRALVPVFRTRFTRTLWEVDFRSSRIEIALDRGRIEATVGRKRAVERIAELELELKDGRAEGLLALALRLAGRGPHGLALVPMVRSKAERGHRLASGTAPRPTKASARGFVDHLEPNMSSGAALRAILSHGLSVLLANTEALHEGRDPEFVHQARVALRRMRSALRLLDRKHKDFPEPLANELRWVGQTLGAARDWDVLVESTLPAMVTAAPAALRARMRTLHKRALRRRDQEHRKAVAALSSARFARLALSLQAWTMTPAPKGGRLARRAPKVLARAHARLFDAAQFFAALSPQRRHRVRILAKRLRYALDVMSVALPAEPTERYVKALAELQDVLGELNDLAVARLHARRLDAMKELRQFGRLWISGRERKLIRNAEERLTQLGAFAQPWSAEVSN
jgi:inorganic triphosphatase YgiF